MKNTTNYNLKLPEGPDKYNISDFNENTEKIDGELKKHADYIADRYNKTEIDNKFSMHEMNVDWKESVDTFDDIVVAYPAPESGWTVNVKDTNYTYRYDGTDWIAISSNAIPKATQAVDGLMSKEQAAVLNKLDQAVGSLQNLTTSEKQSLVGAVNEVKSEVIQLNADLAAEKITDYFEKVDIGNILAANANIILKNNTIYATFEITGDFQQYDYVTIGQIKQKYAPKIKTNGICIISNGASVTKALIANDGSLLVYPKKLISTVLECHFVYCLD